MITPVLMAKYTNVHVIVKLLVFPHVIHKQVSQKALVRLEWNNKESLLSIVLYMYLVYLQIKIDAHCIYV